MVRVLLIILALLAFPPGNAGAGGSAPPATGGITGVRLQSPSGNLKPGERISFGQVFARGDVPAGAGLVATAGGRAVPLQMDIKATHADGSVRHAILTLVVPEGSGNPLGVTLNRGNPSGKAVDGAKVARALLARGYDLKVELTSGGQTYTADAAAALSGALSQGLDMWMKGDLATEFRVHAAITEALLATFDIRAYDNGETRTDVIISNDWITSAGGKLHQPDAVSYDVVIKQNGRTVFRHDRLHHHQNANWHTKIWASGRGPTARVIFDVDDLGRTGAVPMLDTSVRIDEAALQKHWETLQRSDAGPLGAALNETSMGTTGQTGGMNVGIISGWQAMFLLSQDPRAEAIMMANADAAGSVPWHLRDEATGDTITIDDHPGIRTMGRNGRGDDQFDRPYSVEGTGWEPDGAHQPALVYVPYLITGDRYYLDELHAQANSFLVSSNPEYRNAAEGLIVDGQVRGQAWGLRSLGDAAFITPASEREKQYFEEKLLNNLTYYNKSPYIKDIESPPFHLRTDSEELEGYIFKASSEDPGNIAPWQDDFFTTSIAQLAAKGFEQALNLLAWKINFTAGRFISEEKGFNPLLGTEYRLYVYQPDPFRIYDTWAESHRNTIEHLEGREPVELKGNYAGGYADVARGTLASLVSATGDPRAIEAFGFVVGETEKSARIVQGHTQTPTWAFAATLADGSLIQRDDITVAGDGGETLTGGAGSQLLHGKDGNDTISGGAGIDLLFGGDGNDILYGGDDADYLFDGKGAGMLNGGTGNDFLKGNQGADTFRFARTGDGRDVIADLEPGLDRLKISGLADADVRALIASATSDREGNAVLHLAPDDDITLLKISVNELQTSFFLPP